MPLWEKSIQLVFSLKKNEISVDYKRRYQCPSTSSKKEKAQKVRPIVLEDRRRHIEEIVDLSDPIFGSLEIGFSTMAMDLLTYINSAVLV